MKEKKKRGRPLKQRVPFCPHCKTIIKRVIIHEEVTYSNWDYKDSEISLENDDVSVDEGDWDSYGEDYNGYSSAEARCGNCKKNIDDIIYEVCGEYVSGDDVDFNAELIEQFLRKGNVTADKVMVEML